MLTHKQTGLFRMLTKKVCQKSKSKIRTAIEPSGYAEASLGWGYLIINALHLLLQFKELLPPWCYQIECVPRIFIRIGSMGCLIFRAPLAYRNQN